MTMARTSPPTAATDGGMLEGRWDGDVAVFLGVPYAQPPVGALRWAPPAPAEPWQGTHRAHLAGPVAPQPPSRLEAVMGPMQAPAADEDCLTLNVWTPAPGSSERLPVLVFIHGGGYLSGAGSAAWHDGGTMARRGPAVVVTINYRLGALGYLQLPPEVTGGDPVANLGLQDQRLALEWTRSNAAAFGGDPGNVTVFGQSGGGHSILGLAAMAGTTGLFRRAILQSAPLGMPAASAEAAAGVCSTFMEAAGVAGETIEALRSLPVERILEAQRATLLATAVFGDVVPPFQLVVDGTVLTEEPVAAGMRGSLDGIDLLAGFTRDEGTAFYCADDGLWALPSETVLERVAAQRGPDAADRLQTYVDRSPGAPGVAALAETITDRIMLAPVVRLLEERAGRDASAARLFRFSWAPEALKGRLGACHTIELPFVFDNFAAWTDAPMLGGVPAAELAGLGDAVQDAWLAFAATGDPSHAGLPQWEPFAPASGATMDFDVPCRAIDDPSDGRRALWP